MKKFLSLFCALAMVMSVIAVPHSNQLRLEKTPRVLKAEKAVKQRIEPGFVKPVSSPKESGMAKAGKVAKSLGVVPSNAVLADYYDQGEVCVCIYVPADMACNDFVLTGSFNGWSSTVANCASFEPVEGYDGWYVASFWPEENPEAEKGIQAKPIMLDGDGNFSWEYQVGAATTIRGGVQVVQGSYAGEIDLINYGTDEPNVLSIDGWKQNPCTAVYHNYTITVLSDGCDGYVVPFLVGAMNGWTFEQMQLDAEKSFENQVPTYTISFKAAEGTPYQIVSGLKNETGAIVEQPAWDANAYIQQLVNGAWVRLPGEDGTNLLTHDYADILWDLRDNDLRWARCAVSELIDLAFSGDSITWKDNCASAGWWQIKVEKGGYTISLSNMSAESAAGSYAWEDMDPDFCYIWHNDTKFAFTGGSCTVTVTDEQVVVEGTFACEDGNTYHLVITYTPELSDMTFQFTVDSVAGITVTPSNNDPWDYIFVNDSLFATYGAEAVAEAIYQRYGNQYAITGAKTFAWDNSELLSYCTESGTYYLVVWGSGANNITTNADYVEFEFDSGLPENCTQYDAAEGNDFTAEFAGYEIYRDSSSLYIIAQDASKKIQLQFLAENLYFGEYTIGATVEAGSIDLNQGYVLGSFAATLSSEGYLNIPLWCLVSGSVVINENGTIDVDAVNCAGAKIKCHLNAAQEEEIPSDSILLRYYTPGEVCVCIYVPAEIACGDIVLTGSFNGWSSTAANCAAFQTVSGYDGWYVASFVPEAEPDAEKGIQAKPIILDDAGNFNWDYQVGAATKVRGGVQIVPGGYGDEIDLINYGTDAPNVYKIDAWKKNPCGVVTADVLVRLIAPAGAPESIEIIGSFDDWVGQAMSLNNGVWEATVTARGDMEFKFREAGTWDNQILIYDAEYDMWRTMGNLLFGELWEDMNGGKLITLDFSNPAYYTWSNPSTPSPVLVDVDCSIRYVDQNALLVSSEVLTFHVPEAPVVEGFTFLKWQTLAGDLAEGITIQAVYVPNGDPMALPNEVPVPGYKGMKLIRDGAVYILKGDQLFTIQGQRVK